MLTKHSEQILFTVYATLLYSLSLLPDNFKFSFAYDGYEIRGVTLCEEHLVSLELLLLELFD